MIRYVRESLQDVQYDIFIFFIHVLKKITPERTIYRIGLLLDYFLWLYIYIFFLYFIV